MARGYRYERRWQEAMSYERRWQEAMRGDGKRL
jgi:hypothetical protein